MRDKRKMEGVQMHKSLVYDNVVITQNQWFFRSRILNFQNAIQYYK